GTNLLVPVRWFQLYWAAASVLLLVVARLAWVRGTDAGARTRIRIARDRWTMPVISTTVVAAIVLVATGAWVYYNTDVLNPYRTEFERGELRADYEKSFKKYLANPQPKVTGVRIAADIFPSEHRIVFKGTFDMKNKSGVAIPELYVNVMNTADI